MRCSLAVRSFAHAALVLLWLCGSSEKASADATVFVGLTSSSGRPTTAGAFGFFPNERVGYEFEYSGSRDRQDKQSFITYGVNFLVQGNLPGKRMQIYGLAGWAIYDESPGAGGACTPLGVGAKVPLSGALKLRVDYRLFFLRSGDQAPTVPRRHRISVGVALAF
jgi:hypothetical protein